MSRQCDICGKSAVLGNQITQRGKAKYLGGNGRKTTGISRRQFRPNLQRIQIQEGGSAVTRRVSRNASAADASRKPSCGNPSRSRPR